MTSYIKHIRTSVPYDDRFTLYIKKKPACKIFQPHSECPSRKYSSLSYLKTYTYLKRYFFPNYRIKYFFLGQSLYHTDHSKALLSNKVMKFDNEICEMKFIIIIPCISIQTGVFVSETHPIEIQIRT